MAWKKIPAAVSLVAEFDAAFPGRDHASDGSIGDGEHSQNSSNHNPDETGRTPREDSDTINEVHAQDIDADLRRAGWNMSRAVGIILDRCRWGIERRVYEIIWDEHIYTEAHGWSKRTYSGPNDHTHHAHFSFKYGSGNSASNPENITTPWGILAAIAEEEDMPVTKADADVIIDQMGARLAANVAGDTFVAQMKAVAWRYNGNGLQGAGSTLDALSDTQVIQEGLAGLALLVEASNAATAQEVATLVLAGLPDSALSKSDVTEAVLDALRVGTGSSSA